MKSYREEIKVDGSSMNLYTSQPDGAGPFPAAVLIQHQNGVDKFMEAMTERVAAAGYFGVTPDLYHRDGPDCTDPGPTRRARLRDANTINDVNATVGFLKSQKLVNAGSVGIVGFCLGGRVAYLMAAASPSFKAAVTYYGGGIFRASGEGPTPFERTVEISCPIQGHFGELDKNPSLEDMRKLDAELTKHGKAHEFYTYPGADHAFMDPHHVGRYNAQADQLSWPRTLDFFQKYLMEAAPQRAVAS
ncbi:MAG TPA: dienelactone hydrolase family protein [Candidatus Binatia bacterium]|jgi:carboxymethylenebutenolidase